MALLAPPELLGIHVNMPATFRPTSIGPFSMVRPAPAGLSADEKHAFDQRRFFLQAGLGYGLEMANRPQTLYGIADSPIGLAAWIPDHDARSYELISRASRDTAVLRETTCSTTSRSLADEHGDLFGTPSIGSAS